MTLIGILAILLMVGTISSQSYVKKASAFFTPMHGVGSCPAGKVRDWAGICFNKSEAKACINCAPGSAAPAEKPTEAAEKPASTAGEKPEASAQVESNKEDLARMRDFFAHNKSLNDQVLKEGCARTVHTHAYGDCIRYGLQVRELGRNPTFAEKPWFKETGAPPPAGYERPCNFRPEFQSLCGRGHVSMDEVLAKARELEGKGKLVEMHKELEAKEKRAAELRAKHGVAAPTNNTLSWFDTEVEKAEKAEAEKSKSTAAEKPETSAQVGANNEVEKPNAAEVDKHNSTAAENLRH